METVQGHGTSVARQQEVASTPERPRTRAHDKHHLCVQIHLHAVRPKPVSAEQLWIDASSRT
eukprot:5787703-Lingulodinium_polyedra.AAC.1